MCFKPTITTYVNNNMTFNIQKISQKCRCHAEQDLLANVKKIYTNTSRAVGWQTVTFVGCLH